MFFHAKSPDISANLLTQQKSWGVWNYPNQNEAKSSEFNYGQLQSHACPIEVACPSDVAAAGPHLASVLQPDDAGAVLQLLPWELFSGMNPEWSANVHLWLFSENASSLLALEYKNCYCDFSPVMASAYCYVLCMSGFGSQLLSLPPHTSASLTIEGWALQAWE